MKTLLIIEALETFINELEIYIKTEDQLFNHEKIDLNKLILRSKAIQQKFRESYNNNKLNNPT